MQWIDKTEITDTGLLDYSGIWVDYGIFTFYIAALPGTLFLTKENDKQD